MAQLAYRIVDVFSDVPLAGNPLCVVLDPAPEETMRPIAREVNLSETTFPTITADGAYRVRIFTPGAELPFAGHPTLGTAWVLGSRAWIQTSPGATVAVEADATSARMVQPPPTLTSTAPSAGVAALGLPGADGAWLAEAGGLRTLILATDAPIEELQPNLAAVAAAAEAAAPGCANLAVVRRRDDQHLHVRVFVPGFGIPEDPGTGSAAGPIATLAHRIWGTAASVTIHQGTEMGRPCTIEVEVREEGPVVGGRVAAFAEGRLRLP